MVAIRKTVGVILGLIILAVVFRGMSRDAEDKAFTAGRTTQAISNTYPSPRVDDVRERIAASMPDTQKAFVAAIESGRQQYAAGTNDMAKGAARPARGRALCSSLPNGRVVNWVGRISTLSSNSDGKGVLTVEFGPDMYLGTWNNSLSDVGDGTLIDPSSALFAVASSMRKGDWVWFSGSFSKANPDCYREKSLTMAGSMQDPNFVMRFSSITPFQ